MLVYRYIYVALVYARLLNLISYMGLHIIVALSFTDMFCK